MNKWWVTDSVQLSEIEAIKRMKNALHNKVFVILQLNPSYCQDPLEPKYLADVSEDEKLLQSLERSFKNSTSSSSKEGNGPHSYRKASVIEKIKEWLNAAPMYNERNFSSNGKGTESEETVSQNSLGLIESETAKSVDKPKDVGKKFIDDNGSENCKDTPDELTLSNRQNNEKEPQESHPQWNPMETDYVAPHNVPNSNIHHPGKYQSLRYLKLTLHSTMHSSVEITEI